MSSVHRGLDARIFWKECVSLAAAGYDTHLVIAASEDEVRAAANNGVTLHPLPRSVDRLSRMVRQAWRCYRVAKSVKAEIYHFHDPELIPFGMLLKLAGRRVLYDVHEDVPRDIRDKDWLPRWTRRAVAYAMERMEYVGARWFFEIIAATPFIAERFRRMSPCAIAVKNFPLPAELAELKPRSVGRKRQVCYVGSISRSRGLVVLVNALRLVPDLTLVLCGAFADREVEAELRALPGWSQVEYRGVVSRDGVRDVLGESMAGIVTLLPTAAFVDALPVKMFEYMSAGLPVIASDFPLWRDIVLEAGAGICVNPEAPDAIAQAIRCVSENPEAAERMGRAGREAVLHRYNWSTEASKLIAVYAQGG